MAVGRVPTFGSASHILHWRERDAGAIRAGGAGTSPWVKADESTKPPDAVGMPIVLAEQVSRYPSRGRSRVGDFTELGKLGLSHVAGCPRPGEIMVDVGEKYAGEVFAYVSATSIVALEMVLVPSSAASAGF